MYQVIQTSSGFNWHGLPTLVIFAPAPFRPNQQALNPDAAPQREGALGAAGAA